MEIGEFRTQLRDEVVNLVMQAAVEARLDSLASTVALLHLVGIEADVVSFPTSEGHEVALLLTYDNAIQLREVLSLGILNAYTKDNDNDTQMYSERSHPD